MPLEGKTVTCAKPYHRWLSSSARCLFFNPGPENIFPERHVIVGSGLGMFGSPWTKRSRVWEERHVGLLAIGYVFVVLMQVSQFLISKETCFLTNVRKDLFSVYVLFINKQLSLILTLFHQLNQDR
jgi:hypothetical protein